MQCQFCKEYISDGAIKCKHCKSILVPINQDSDNDKTQKPQVWASVTSFAIALCCIIARLDAIAMNQDEIRGYVIALSAAIGFAIYALRSGQRGRGWATAGIVLSVLGLIDLF